MREFLLFVGLASLFCLPAQAEVITDGTVGPALSLPGPEYQIGADLGTQKGGNLFQSFSQFNLTQIEAAIFSGPAEINHIISRVTGGKASQLDGSLRSTIPGSQLWLFNPAGIEQNGLAIDVPGGAAIAPALALSLKDGGLYNAAVPENSLLTDAPPQAFFINPLPQTLPAVIAEGNTATAAEEQGQPPTLSNETTGRLLEQPLGCGSNESLVASRFTVSFYQGSPLSPDDWQGSRLPPLSE
jgi:filamentous hemagglutinin family protein